MNCVASIIKVADVIDDDAVFAERVHIVFHGELIAWRDFFFRLTEHRRLWQAREKTRGRPVTLEFERLDLERKADKPYYTANHYQISGKFGTYPRAESDHSGSYPAAVK